MMNFIYSFLSYLDQNHTGNWWSYHCGPGYIKEFNVWP